MERRHNATRDNRCAYTLGRERCPALGTRRIGQRYYCEHHKTWFDNGLDRAFGEQVLRDAQASAQQPSGYTSRRAMEALETMRAIVQRANDKDG